MGELHFRLGRHFAAEDVWREVLRWTSASADQEFLRRQLADCGRFLGLDADRNFRDTPAMDRAPSPMGTFCDSLCGGAIAEPDARRYPKVQGDPKKRASIRSD